ncbi:MAG: hypothetical protein EOM54_12665 [Clostridia bacterium]|nr:hypothetical protein [Clostridia bacterium]
MKKNLMKEKIEKGEPVIGTFLDFGNADNAEILAISPMDYIIIDAEHGPYGAETVANMIRAIELHDCTPIVRVQDHVRSSILKVLDVGARGLIIPMIFNADQVRDIVRWGKYFPVGERGCAMGRQADFGQADCCKGSIQDYFNAINEETYIIPQCETVGALENIEEIVNIPGVDGIFIGPFDLSISMGIPAQFDKPEFQAALEKVLGACKAAGKFCMILSTDPAKDHANLKKGFIPCIHTDVNIYFKALKAVCEKVLNG